MPPLVARPVPPGSTIGVVTPASPPETRAEVERGIAWWESQGYRVKLMPGALERVEDVLTDPLGGLGVPVLYNLPLGHGATLATLPLGVQATLDADAKC